jgi:hypothetical protein
LLRRRETERERKRGGGREGKGKGFEIELGCTLGGVGNCFALSVEESRGENIVN